jgi:hypothetical protein
VTLVFLLEEPSMKSVLEGLVPRVAPGRPFILVAHNGKQDLEKSIARKLRAWRDPSAIFIVVRDQDAADCLEVKRRLLSLCAAGGREDVVVRVVCRALESWFLGDLAAVDAAFGTHLAGRQMQRKYRDPDRLHAPHRELETLVPDFTKGAGARALGPLVDLDNERSSSFRCFVTTLRAFALESS